jgi:hypothetical protein
MVLQHHTHDWLGHLEDKNCHHHYQVTQMIHHNPGQ